MPDITIPTNVYVEQTNGPQAEAAGATIGLCVPLYRDPADATLKPASAALTDVEAAVVGISIAPTLSGDEAVYVADGRLKFSSNVLIPGLYYVLSNTTGKICPAVDVTRQGGYLTYLFHAETASEATLDVNATGTQIPVPTADAAHTVLGIVAINGGPGYCFTRGAHGFVGGETITISGNTETYFNAAWTVGTVPTTHEFTVAAMDGGANGLAGVGGSWA